ncbi:MAG: GTPase ObgE, partial [Clostridiales Family XIII bacterium]|nr:GTPase ObgE [Clostridiales Family XIII bacterium]
MFIDSAEITILAGRGGDGAVSFRHEPFVPNGGPDGGNGGKGGDVILAADRNLRTLMDFKYKKKYKAEAGQAGMKRNKYGKKGADLTIKLPVGTIVTDGETGMFMADLSEDGMSFIAAIGGKGGLGNSNFKNSVRQAPNFAEAGGEGTQRSIMLELKLIADVGLVGFPNVGKSTLLASSSSARPKVADYHFTTLVPNLGVIKLANTDFVMADIPGLIEGASSGAGLGFDFLRHVERTKLLVHVVDITGSEGRKPLDDFLTINAELSQYSAYLEERPQIVALNKTDVADLESEDARALIEYLEKHNYAYHFISAATGSGVRELLNDCAETLYRIEQDGAEDNALVYGTRLEVLRKEEEPDYREVRIEMDGDVFVLTGKQLKKIFNSTNFNDYGS